MSDPTPDSNRSGKKRTWREELRRRTKKIARAAHNRRVQWRDGSFSDQKAVLIARLKEIEGGNEALKAAQDAGARINVVAPRDIDGVKGRFSRRKSGPLVRIASSRDVPRMTGTLWHELRHLRQHIARADLRGGTSRLHDTRTQHVISMMIEADAFTAQALMCLQQNRLGNPEYLTSFLAAESNTALCVRDFLARRPFESFDSDTHFSRSLFTALMRSGMPGYQAKYFEGYRKSFEKVETAGDLKKLAASVVAPPDFAPSSDLMEIYGKPASAITSARTLANEFYKVQPSAIRATLRLIEETVARADRLSPQEFTAARKEILAKSAKLSKQFRRAAAKPAAPPGKWRRRFGFK